MKKNSTHKTVDDDIRYLTLGLVADTSSTSLVDRQEQAVIKVCRSLVNKRFKHLIEWCRVNGTEKVEFLVTQTDIRGSGFQTTIEEFMAAAKRLTCCRIKEKLSFDNFIDEPVVGGVGLAGHPSRIYMKFSWEVLDVLLVE